jgi:alpha-galactosidase
MIQLRSAGVNLFLDDIGSGLPRIVHWGADLGAELPDPEVVARATQQAVIPSQLDAPAPLSLLPERSVGHFGRPGLSGHRNGRDWSTLFEVRNIARDGESAVVVDASDPAAGLSLRTELRLEPSGLLRLRHTLTNDGNEPYEVSELAGILPVPPQAGELLDFTGRWCRERHPQRRSFAHGTFVRENRRGRTGHDATVALVAGTAGFGFRSGEVWAVHLGWSGNHTTYAERSNEATSVLGAAELLEPGEVVLAAGESYSTPWIFAAYSDHGLDGISEAFHGYLRARPQHPRPDRPRKVILNTWEAVYFDHDLATLRRLADAAATIGVERFVLDDGWFRHRRDGSAGLGDWYVDEEVWPQGLTPLIDHVTGLGIEFGLWVEPEMVNPDSDLYRAHPDWILSVEGRVPPSWRKQQVLDLVNPDAYGYILDRLDALLRENDIRYLKWDQNRDYTEPGLADGRPAVHEQTLAVYRLLDELRARHPSVEIESCSSGGSRVDLGILERTDRVWASDCNDALERQTIQRWTSLVVPPELIGAHVGPPVSHTTHRVHALSFRAVTALFGHFGMEWDIASAGADDRDALARVVAFYKDKRALLHSGDVVRADHEDPSAWLHGVVARDKREAVFAFVQLRTPADALPNLARFPGLDADRRYRVEPVYLAGVPTGAQVAPPPWLAEGCLTATGRVLEKVGLRMPGLHPEQALLLQITAV